MNSMLFRLYVKYSLIIKIKERKGEGEKERETQRERIHGACLSTTVPVYQSSWREETTKHLLMIMHYKYGFVQLALHSKLQTSSMISVFVSAL